MADLLPSLHRKGVSNFAIVHRHDLGLSPIRESVAGGEILRVPILGKMLYAPISPLFVFHLRQTIKTFKPDLIHAHMPNLSVFNLFLLRDVTNIPLIVHWHSDVLATGKETALRTAYKLYAPLERAILKRSKLIVATSEDYFLSSKPLQEFRSKVCVVPIGLNSAAPNSTPTNDLKKTRDEFRVLCIGRFTPYKAQDVLIRAIKNLPDCHLDLIGNGSKEIQKDLLSLAKDMGIEDRVTILHNLDSAVLQHKLEASDVLCLPSIERTEAFGVVLLEAMRAEKPVAVSAVKGSGMTWVVEDECTGLHVVPGDSKQLEKAIDRLQKDELLRIRLGKAGRKRFLQTFTIDKVSDQLIALYKGLVNGESRNTVARI